VPTSRTVSWMVKVPASPKTWRPTLTLTGRATATGKSRLFLEECSVSGNPACLRWCSLRVKFHAIGVSAGYIQMLSHGKIKKQQIAMNITIVVWEYGCSSSAALAATVAPLWL